MEEAVLKSILTVNLGVKEDERVLIFTDLVEKDEPLSPEERERRENLRFIARRLKDVADGMGIRATYEEFPAVGSHGAEPPRSLWKTAFGERCLEELENKGLIDRLLDKSISKGELELVRSIVTEYREYAVDCVVALSNYSTTHTRFRKLLTECAGTRYASMPLFEESMLHGAMQVDWYEIRRLGERIKEVLQGMDWVHITTPHGTDIRFSIKGRPLKVDDGILTEPGSYGNLPAGEVFVAPVEGTATGRLVLKWAPTRRLEGDVIITVEEGRAVRVEGEDAFVEELEKALSANPLTGNIAELGIGTNPKATKPDNILESEKILGTIHIALGDNSTFGGTVKVPFHQDFVFFEPTVELEGEGEKRVLLKDGRLMVGG